MKNQEPSLADRLGESTKAKRVLRERARENRPANDPMFAEKQAARVAAAEARRLREAERKAARLLEKTRKAEKKAAEVAARAAAREEERALLAAKIAEQAASDAALLARQKAARDLRYAARKARR